MEINEFARDNFMNYSMEVIKNRAIPAIDGCKPIHRRILYVMKDVGNVSTKPTRKCAKITGEVMGRVHPHGDSSIYDALVRLAQPWKMRYPLVEIQGNGGNIQGDKAAASRYTECRLTPLGELMTNNIAKKCVPMEMNYSEEEEIPTLLTSEFPNLLCNPNLGIAVSMSSTTLPHNVNEICGALIAYIQQNGNFTVDDLMKYVSGPDFPTGGTIINGNELRGIYASGRGSVKVRSKYYTETVNGKVHIVITEVPYLVSIEDKIYERIKSMVLDEGYTDIENVQNNIGNKGFEIRVICRRGANVNKVIKDLCEKTGFQSSISMNNTVLIDGVPKQLTFIEMMDEYLKFRHGVIRKIAEFDRNKAYQRSNVIEGLLVAIADIDNVIGLIKVSGSRSEAKEKLIAAYSFNEEQVNAILDMKLSRLTRLEEVDLRSELGELKKTIEYNDKLIRNVDGARDKYLIEQLQEIKKKFGDARRTVVSTIGTTPPEDSTPKDIVVMRSGSQLYVIEKPRSSISTSTKGSLTAKMKFDEVVSCSTKNRLLVYTKTGQLTLVNLAELEIGAITPLTTDGEVTGMCIEEPKKFLISLTKNGVVKKSEAAEYTFKRVTYVCKLKEDDEIVWVGYANDDDFLLAFGENDKALKVAVEKLSTTGKNTQGSRFMSCIVRCAVCGSSTSVVMSVSGEKLKATSMDEYVEGAKGGSGVVVNEGTTGCWIGVANFFLLTNGTKLSLAVLDTYPLKSRTATGATVKGLISLSH